MPRVLESCPAYLRVSSSMLRESTLMMCNSSSACFFPTKETGCCGVIAVLWLKQATDVATRSGEERESVLCGRSCRASRLLARQSSSSHFALRNRGGQSGSTNGTDRGGGGEGYGAGGGEQVAMTPSRCICLCSISLFGLIGQTGWRRPGLRRSAAGGVPTTDDPSSCLPWVRGALLFTSLFRPAAQRWRVFGRPAALNSPLTRGMTCRIRGIQGGVWASHEGGVCVCVCVCAWKLSCV